MKRRQKDQDDYAHHRFSLEPINDLNLRAKILISMKIADDIYLLDGAGYDSNVYCIAGEVLVDTGTGIFFRETLEQMQRYGLRPGKIKLIILTHAHFDHFGGAAEFKKKTRACLAIHPDDISLLKNKTASLAEMFDADYKIPKIDKVLEHGEIIKVGRYSLRVIHTPGHSPGSICLYDDKNKILVSGDTIFIDGFGRTDLEGGDEKAMQKSLQNLKALDIRTLLPGHGAPASQDNIYAKDAIKKILEKI